MEKKEYKPITDSILYFECGDVVLIDEDYQELCCTFKQDGCVIIFTDEHNYARLSIDNLKELINLIETDK